MNVLYYVGPYKAYNGKWRQMQTGPWSLASDPDDLHIKISDKNGNTREVSIDRLKLFKKRDLNELEDWSKINDESKLKLAVKNQPNLSDNDDDVELN